MPGMRIFGSTCNIMLLSAPSPVQNLRVMGATTTQLKVGWDPPEQINGILKGYVLSTGTRHYVTEHDLWSQLQYM